MVLGFGFGCCCNHYYYYTVPKVTCAFCPDGLPRTVHASFTAGAGCSVAPFSATLTYDPSFVSPTWWGVPTDTSIIIKAFFFCGGGGFSHGYYMQPPCNGGCQTDPPTATCIGNVTGDVCSPLAGSGAIVFPCVAQGCNNLNVTFSE